MIKKKEILDRTEITNLNPHVIEKDYALGWLLAGISAHKEIGKQWFFKGGTCLKKCYFETYRFSEDLDFTLKNKSHINLKFLKNTFFEISDWIYKNTGLEFPTNLQDFDIYKSPKGQMYCQGKLSYQGPVSPKSGGLPRIKLDLTADEEIVLPPSQKYICHPYSDCPTEKIKVIAYVYEEAFAEKIRALYERANPRDLYDVINLYRNANAFSNVLTLKKTLKRKCEFKKIPVPSMNDILNHKSKLQGSWHVMLGHQLPYLPPLDSFLKLLSDFFKWLETGKPKEDGSPYKLSREEKLIDIHTSFLPINQEIKSYLELIRFASANRLCVKFKYKNSKYKVECYSLRKIKEKIFVLYAWDTEKAEMKLYDLNYIQGVEITNYSFFPKYLVELIPKI